MQHEKIGKRIKARREELNISAVDLAARLSISKSTLHRYENGDIKHIKMTMLDAIARELKVNAGWLLRKVSHKESGKNVHAYHELSVMFSDMVEFIKYRDDLTIHGKTLSDIEKKHLLQVLTLAENILD